MKRNYQVLIFTKVDYHFLGSKLRFYSKTYEKKNLDGATIEIFNKKLKYLHYLGPMGVNKPVELLRLEIPMRRRRIPIPGDFG